MIVVEMLDKSSSTIPDPSPNAALPETPTLGLFLSTGQRDAEIPRSPVSERPPALPTPGVDRGAPATVAREAPSLGAAGVERFS